MVDASPIYARAAKAAARKANAASTGTLKLNGLTFVLTFNPREGFYETSLDGRTTDAEGYTLPRFNTASLTTARRFLRDHYA